MISLFKTLPNVDIFTPTQKQHIVPVTYSAVTALEGYQVALLDLPDETPSVAMSFESVLWIF